MHKYENLADHICDVAGIWPGYLAVIATLRWLDENPDMLPSQNEKGTP